MQAKQQAASKRLCGGFCGHARHSLIGDPAAVVETQNAEAIQVILKGMNLREKYLQAEIHSESTIKDSVPDSVITDLTNLWNDASANSMARAFCDERLQLLELAFSSYQLKNRRKEYEADKKDVTDFYRVIKIDCHLHYEAIATTKQFLDWLRDKYIKEGHIVVNKDTGTTVKDILEKEGFSLTVAADDLGTEATFVMKNNFTEFNKSFNPLGSQELHDLIWGFDTELKGRWAAEYLQHFCQLAAAHNVFLEPRLSIFGRNRDEWAEMARWAKMYDVCSIPNLRIAVQMPRIFPVWKGAGLIESVGDMFSNFFEPLYEATLKPEEHPELSELLKKLKIIDTVDDESKHDDFDLRGLPLPDEWTAATENPSYAYYTYYFYANITAINTLRKQRGLNTFQFRPHCGESGPVDHLASGFLFCNGISHGINLSKSPVMQYLFYVCQIGIAVSPLSNRALFLRYLENPFPSFFRRGLVCCLTTDDPLQFHITDCPLMEEYATARSVWDFTAIDLSEIARNSVLVACHADEAAILLGGDDPNVINLPRIRLEYRAKALAEELKILGKD